MTRRILVVVAAILATSLGATASALAQDAVYTADQTIPVPPASNFAGSGGGDGWAVAMSTTQVFNVFHHLSQLTVACHIQADASSCWTPRTLRDLGDNSNFASNGHPEMYFDRAEKKLYVYTNRSSDGTAGVVCVDIEQAATVTNPNCGFTALTAAGEGPSTGSGTSGVSTGMLTGSRWYAFNFVNGVNVSGGRNTMLCFDVATKAACPGQPYPIDIGAGNVTVGSPEPATALIGTKAIVPVNAAGGHRLACFDTETKAGCAGFPVPLAFSYAAVNGAPFPTLASDGTPTGFCLPTSSNPCFGLDGTDAPTPAGMAAAIGENERWNGPAFTVGPRVLVPDGSPDRVQCWNFSTNAVCDGFPKTFSGLNYLYSVNRDPDRPTCVWVNADGGSSQIQNFDAFTGGACGTGPTRVLASQFVVSQKVCEPSTYTSLKILTPAPGQYASGTVAFANGDGQPIPGIGERAIGPDGTVDLSGLNLNTTTGLPQFLITLTGGSGTPSEVVVRLTWTGRNDPACAKTGTTVVAPTSTTSAATAAPVATAAATPPSRRCLSKRNFRIRIVSRRADPVRSATVMFDGRKLKVQPRKINGQSRLTALVDLRGKFRGKVTLSIRATLASGKVRKGTRTYNLCRPKLSSRMPRL